MPHITQKIILFEVGHGSECKGETKTLPEENTACCFQNVGVCSDVLKRAQKVLTMKENTQTLHLIKIRKLLLITKHH